MLIDFRNLFPKYNINPKGVLHIGANVGEEAPIYNLLGIMRQIWVEANPEIFVKLKQNIANNPEAIAYNFAAGDEMKSIILHVSNNAGQSSSVLPLGTHKQQHPDVHYVSDIEVPMMRCDTFEFEGCDFLNIDAQGFELNILKGMGDKLKQFQWAYIECNKDYVYEGCALVGEVEEYMKIYGFRMVESKWVGNWGDCLFIK